MKKVRTFAATNLTTRVEKQRTRVRLFLFLGLWSITNKHLTHLT